jgi:hypothetical protein
MGIGTTGFQGQAQVAAVALAGVGEAVAGATVLPVGVVAGILQTDACQGVGDVAGASSRRGVRGGC